MCLRPGKLRRYCCRVIGLKEATFQVASSGFWAGGAPEMIGPKCKFLASLHLLSRGSVVFACLNIPSIIYRSTSSNDTLDIWSFLIKQLLEVTLKRVHLPWGGVRHLLKKSRSRSLIFGRLDFCKGLASRLCIGSCMSICMCTMKLAWRLSDHLRGGSTWCASSPGTSKETAQGGGTDCLRIWMNMMAGLVLGAWKRDRVLHRIWRDLNLTFPFSDLLHCVR